MSNIIYIPWTLPLAGESLSEAQQWVSNEAAGNQKHTRNWQIVMYQDPNAPLSHLKAGSTIYVQGHGAPGDPTIDPDDSGNGSIAYDEVCDRMISDGLKRAFFGTIKFSNCHSAVPTLGHQAFAAKASQYMRFKKGYMLISFVGYFGSIDGEYNREAGDKYDHRYVTMFGHEVKSKWAQWRF